MAPMRHELPATHLRAVREARSHSLSDHADGQTLQLRRNIAPENHAIERAIIAPRNDGFALLRGRSGTAAPGFGRRGRVVTSCAHRLELGWPSGLETRDR